MSDDNLTLADLRRIKGLSQQEVGQRMGVTKARVSHIERDFPNVRFSVARAYFEALGARVKASWIGDTDVNLAKIASDPRGARDHGDRRTVRKKNAKVVDSGS